MKKTQIVHVRGGETFKNDSDYLNFLKNYKVTLEPKKKWHREYLKKKLENECQIIKPELPHTQNAKYRDWKIIFEKYLEVLDNEIILI
jgi:predicted nuclease of restriction endonuclease-like RecB superfamily